MIKIDNKHLEIAQILIEEIKYGNTPFYEEVRRKVGIPMKVLWGYLGDLSYFSFNNSMPLISAIVINKEDNVPGPGFYGVYEELRAKKVKNEDDRLMSFASEVKLVMKFKEWNKLIELLEEEINSNSEGNHLKLDITRLKKRKQLKRLSLVDNDALNSEKIYKEGREKLEVHVTKERNIKLIKDAKDIFINKNGRLYCEICKFDFEEAYGELGKDFIEGHHINPISKLEEETESRIEDIKMLCSNCHRMVHRGIERNISIENIIALFR